MKQTVLQQAVRALFLPIMVGFSLPALSAGDTAQKQGTQASTGSTSSATPGRQQNKNMRFTRASVLLDAEVTDMAGRDIGKIEDLVVQLNSGNVRYAAVSLSGLEGVSRDRIYAVPVRELKRGTQEDKLVLDTTAQRTKQMRSWERDRWDTAFEERVDRRQSANDQQREAREERKEAREERKEARVAERDQAREERKEAREERREANRAQAQADRSAASTGSSAPGIVASNEFRANKLIGTKVESPQGENLGEVKDLVIDLNNQKVQYGVISFDPGILSAERNHAVPLQRLTVPRGQRSAEPDKLVFNAPKERLKEFRGFSDNNWPDFNDHAFVSDLDRRFNRWFGGRDGSAASGSTRNESNRSTTSGKDTNR